MVRSANLLFVLLAIAPGIYILLGALVTTGRGGFASNSNIIPALFLGLLAVSIVTVGLTILIQTSKRIIGKLGYNPLTRVFQTFSTGAALSEAHAAFGLVLTLLSGSISYGIGFCLLAWASLYWVRYRFKHNLKQLPDSS